MIRHALTAPAVAAPPLRVVLVDDDRDQHTLMRAWLHEIYGSGAELLWVSRYDEALRALRDAAYDVCFVDHHLGSRTGLELIRELQRLGCRTPLVVLTGSPDAHLDAAALAAGAADFLEKDGLGPRLLERSIRYTLERTRAAVHLREREQRYRALVEHAAEGVGILDEHAAVRYANECAARMLDQPGEPIASGAWLLQPDDPAIRRAFAACVTQPGARITIEGRRRRPDDSLQWIEYVLVNRLEEPAVQGIVVNLRDITERVVMEQALHLQADLGRILAYASSFEDAQDELLRTIGERLFARVAMRWRSESGALHFAGAWHRTGDAGAEQFIDGSRRHVVHPRHSAVARAIATSRPLWLIDASRSPRFARRHIAAAAGIRGGVIVPIPTAHGSSAGVVEAYWGHACPHNERLLAILNATGRQIGHFIDRVAAHAALESSEKQLRALFDHGSDAVLIADDAGRYVDANPAACRLLGVPREHLIGASVADFVVPEQRDAFPELWEGFLQAGGDNGETVLVRPNGERRVADYRAIAHFLPGQHLSQLRDITEQRALEHQLLQSQKMETVGRLAGGIAHDFNNLLMVIMGNSEMICGDLPAGDPLRRAAEDVLAAAKSAAGLTSQLLAFSRKQLMQTTVFDLNETVSSMDRMLARLIGENITVVTQLAAGLDPIEADQAQIQQVIVNLVVNARDAMPSGGRLTLETRLATISAAHGQAFSAIQPGRYVLLSVSDTGVGMDAETRARIFEPFFTTKERGRGTGLGLATVYGTVRQTGGYIDVESTPGAGTTFRVYLPSMAGAAPAAPAAAPSSAGGSELVLVVEDADGVRHLTSELLRRRGYAVVEAGSGEEALRLVEDGPGRIDLLLTDVVMPGMSGRALYDALLPRFPALRVIFCSGYTDEVIVHHGVRQGGQAFLQKPFTGAGLLALVREVLDA